jgi:hypothetical protein
MIQTNAAVSRGNSGGPLINALGEQIGVIATIGNDLQNVAFAIAIDHVRRVLPEMLSVEQRQALWLGAACDPLAAKAIVQSVAADSPAGKAGLQPGDELVKLGGFELQQGIDLQLALLRCAAGDAVTLEAVRDGEPLHVEVSLAALPLTEPASGAGLEAGLQYAVHRGDWSQLPPFGALTPERSGRCERIDLTTINAPEDNFAVEYTGFVKVPADDLYAFYTTSDDGSRLWIGEHLVVDSDGLHPARECGGLVRLRAGLHPLRVQFFERGGAEVLDVAWESSSMPKSRLTPAELFSPPAP